MRGPKACWARRQGFDLETTVNELFGHSGKIQIYLSTVHNAIASVRVDPSGFCA